MRACTTIPSKQALSVLILLLLSRSHRSNAGLPFGLPSSEQIGGTTKDRELSFFNANEVMEYETDVAIVGGGLAGLALWIGIATHLPDCRVVLMERQSHFERAGATLGSAANGVRALNELADDPHFVQTKIHPHGRDMMPHENIPVYVLPWCIVRDALLDRAQELAKKAKTQTAAVGSGNGGTTATTTTHPCRLEFWKGIEIHKLVQRRNHVELELSNADGATIRVRSKLVVGCDGVQSTVRSFLGRKPAEDLGVRVWRGTIQVNDLKKKHKKAHKALKPLLTQGYAPFILRDPNDALSYVVVFNHHECVPGLLLWQMGTPNPDDATVTKFLVDDVQDPNQKDILEALFCYTPNILHTKLRTINMDRISDKPADKVTQGWGGTKRVTLIGDAAHACRPTDGQGANMAFEDACVLVRSLKKKKKVERTNSTSLFLENIDDLVLQFENERRPRVKRIHQDQAERALKQGKDWTRWSDEFMEWVYSGV